ncbi:hypothetical protein GH742_03545 [Legionella sp. MW5194]|uniref:kynureninase/PvdN C-terminal domain-containing protein n=1 Tax=Legionella sp. MW5194 TaxID=2662448 RepID=UPI00193CB639|nr:hypothetical protein [Legionella sp. MW5194]QRN03011.1 hypothetical protein GH742_03545 [Legionella sp. MW5194]
MLSNTEIKQLLTSDPKAFAERLKTEENALSAEFAAELDKHDPLNLKALFDLGPITPFAGHSLGPVFVPTIHAIEAILKLQREQLHSGHFPDTASLGGNWFDCDVDPQSVLAMQALLGFDDPCEFVFTQAGLSTNLGNLLDTFYKPTLKDWKTGKTKICHLATEFFSDQAVVHSVIKRQLQTAKNFDLFLDNQAPTPDALTLKLSADENGLYSSQAIIEFVKQHAHEIQVLHLSDLVFNTGQRLNLAFILQALKKTIEDNHIIVGLDLAHTVGNRPINLKKLEVVTYAVGCSYKHCSGTAGSPFGIYVNQNTDLNRYPPIQGWKAAESGKVFGCINGFTPTIMATQGAHAFRTSNASPVALAPIQTYVKTMADIGWDKLIAKSECLTLYLLALLKKHLGDTIQLITPEQAEERGATLVFRIKGLKNVSLVEEELKKPSSLGQFEVDTRPPNNIRITAHYGYIGFGDIQKMTLRLKEVVAQVLEAEAKVASSLSKVNFFHEVKPTSSSDEVKQPGNSPVNH